MKKIPITAPMAVIIVVAVAVILFPSCSPSDAVISGMSAIPRSDSTFQQSVDLQSPTYVFRTGDQLRISIRGYPEFDTTMSVSESGTISMHLIGEVPVAGLTRAQLTQDLISKLSQYIKAEVNPTITVLNALVLKVSLLGAVGRQDNYAITTKVSLLQILAMAGGAAPDADLRHIKIFRNGDTGNMEEVDLTQYISKGSDKEMPMINPGDTVFIPHEENIIRELSDFFRDTVFLFSLFTIAK